MVSPTSVHPTQFLFAAAIVSVLPACGQTTVAVGDPTSTSTGAESSSSGEPVPSMAFRSFATDNGVLCAIVEPDGAARCFDVGCSRSRDPGQWPLHDDGCWADAGLPEGEYVQLALGRQDGFGVELCGIRADDGSIACAGDVTPPPGVGFTDLAFNDSVRYVGGGEGAIGWVGVAAAGAITTKDAVEPRPEVLAVDGDALLVVDGICSSWWYPPSGFCSFHAGSFIDVVAATAEHPCGISAQGALECVESEPPLVGVLRFADLVDDTTGCGLLEDGTVECAGELAAPDGDFTSVAVGTQRLYETLTFAYGCGVRDDQSAMCWGPPRPWCGDAICDPAQQCYQGACEWCGDGACFACGDGHCRSDEVCEDGACIQGCDRSADCEGLDRCIDGVCRDRSLGACQRLTYTSEDLPTPDTVGARVAVRPIDGGADLVVADLGGVWIHLAPDLEQRVPGADLDDGLRRIAATGDLDGDGDGDIVVVAQNSGAASTLLAGPSWIAGPDFSLPESPTGLVALADADGDGRDDLFYSSGEDDELVLRRSLGDGTFSPWPSLPGPRMGTWAVTDVDGSGGPDVVTATADALRVQFDPPQDATEELAADRAAVASSSIGAAALDLDGDGVVELVHFAAGSEGLSLDVWHDASSRAAAVKQSASSATPLAGSASTGDLDGDGSEDLALPTQAGMTVLFGAGDPDGGFACGQEFGSAQASDLVIADFDGDGVAEIVLVDEGGDSVYLVTRTN